MVRKYSKGCKTLDTGQLGTGANFTSNDTALPAIAGLP